ncbi:MAG TPA: hypothetical protein VF487_20320 [Chitinophagaceae bacterium]
MKKLLFALAFAVSLIAGSELHAQGSVNHTTTAYGNLLDTVDNTESHVMTPYKPSSWKTGVSFVVVVKKISGTVAGSLELQGSMDGTEFALIGSATTPADQSKNYVFNTTQKFVFYRISWAGAGTMSASFKQSSLLY